MLWPKALTMNQPFHGGLASLSGDAGARKVIESGRHPVERIEFADGAVDIDRPEDLEKLGEADS